MLNFDEPSAERMAKVLESKGFHVIRSYPFSSDIGTLLSKQERSCDLLIVDVSNDIALVRHQLTYVSRYKQLHGPKPMLLCVCRRYRGAPFQLELERKGARVVYVR